VSKIQQQVSVRVALAIVPLVFVFVGCNQMTGPKNSTSRTIPIEEVYTTVQQPSAKWLDRSIEPGSPTTFRSPYGKELSDVLSSPSARYPIFLVRATDIKAAIQESSQVEGPQRGTGGRSALPKSIVWLTAHLGDAVPVAGFAIDHVSVSEKSIEVAYRIPREMESKPTPAALISWFIWVPLGDLPAGEYKLEIIDATNGKVVASRVEQLLK
jgi:hypothetical protein